MVTGSPSASADYLFHQEMDCKVYEYLGCQRVSDGFSFRIWLPNASGVCVVGDFYGWDEGIPMRYIAQAGIWECTVAPDGIRQGDKYKFKITHGDSTVYKADMFAFASECPPNTASLVCDLDEYVWRDEGWIRHRREIGKKFYSLPLNIYELDLATWRSRDDGGVMTYSEAARELAPYVKQMGYTHIQLLPIWRSHGDEVYECSMFAPTAQMGGHKDFMSFVDAMHEAGVGVLLDWSFSELEYNGIHNALGQPVESEATASCLVSNALFWVDKYHLDGLCVGDIGDLSQKQWKDFVELVADTVKCQHPDVLMISRRELDGVDLCFDGEWVEKTFDRAVTDPFLREYSVDDSGRERKNLVLPVSYDELTGGKKTFLDKMSGDYWQKFAGTRTFFGYMMTFPGKKLTFMGSDIGQFREWDGKNAMEWFLLDHDSHARLQRYIADLGQLYLRTPALWQQENVVEGISISSQCQTEQGVISYRRADDDGDEVIVVINFTPVAYENYKLGVPCGGEYREIFNSDDVCYGGSGVVNSEDIVSESASEGSNKNSIVIKVPPLATSILRCVRRTQF